jgi:hypothetical protein
VLPLALVLSACTAGGVEAPRVAEPWADRPVVELRFDVADDLRRVGGHESVLFTPDLPTCELVFRAWPNKPATARHGSSLVVSEVRVDGAVADVRDVAAGAPAEAPAGTLLEVPLADCADPGRQLSIELDFDLRLGRDVDERVGTSSDEAVAWFATAFPLLAWERGRGWERGPAVAVNGEMAVSEEFELAALEVTAPTGYEVFGTGRAADAPEETGDGTAIHRFSADSVRDVAVTVGDLDLLEGESDGVRVHLGADRGARRSDLDTWMAVITDAIDRLEGLLGPFPYPDLWVTVLSAQSSGIEFPGAIQFGDTNPEKNRDLVTHELAHMWFYALVGNDQGNDPWLDEAFTTFAQMVVDGEDVGIGSVAPRLRGHVGEPMTFFTRYDRPSSAYVDVVYTAGAATLLEARQRAGEDEFDDALRRYVAEQAHSVATPEDVVAAFADLPEVLDVLRDAGALSGG